MSDENGPVKKNKRFGGADLALVKRSDDAQRDFQSFVCDNSKFSRDEKGALEIDSAAAFDQFLGLTVNVKHEFDAVREHRVGQKAQNFAASAHDVLQHVEPIVQLVKDFGHPFGGMAIGTISFLLVIAKNRADMEKNITTTLLQIKDRVPGLKVYQHIYNDNHELDQQFQTKIVMAYESFVGFCMAAVRYYSKGGLKRWLRAIWGSSMMLDDRASKVQEALVDVRYMSEELLNKNVDAVKRINIDQTRKIEGLEAQIRQLQQGHDYDRLERIRELIGQKTYSRETELDLFRKYQRDVQADFDTNWTNLERMQGPLLQNFKNGIIFQDWRQSQHSSLLIMAGYNNESVYSSGKCWLSPIALDTITQLNEADQPDPYAFYILGLRPDTEMVQQVLSCLIIQLLNQNRGALQNEAVYAELNAELREYAKLLEESQQTTALSHALRIKDIKKAINKAKAFIEELSNKANAILQKVALRVLNTFDPTKPVWIVLDRGDKCKAGAFNHRKKLAKSLVYLVENAKVNVKILAIVNGYDWRVDEMADELGQSKEESLNVHKMEQKRID